MSSNTTHVMQNMYQFDTRCPTYCCFWCSSICKHIWSSSTLFGCSVTATGTKCTKFDKQSSPKLKISEASDWYLQVQLDVKGQEVKRQFEVLYLDEKIRVAQFLSDEEPEPVYFVFKRIADPQSEEVPAEHS